MLRFVKLLWPDSLCEHIAVQTNLYARQSNASGWVCERVDIYGLSVCECGWKVVISFNMWLMITT